MAAWRLFWCPGQGDLRVHEALERDGFTRQICGRTRTHGPHTYADKCACEPTNPVIQAKRARAREEAQRRQAMKSGKPA